MSLRSRYTVRVSKSDRGPVVYGARDISPAHRIYFSLGDRWGEFCLPEAQASSVATLQKVWQHPGLNQLRWTTLALVTVGP